MNLLFSYPKECILGIFVTTDKDRYTPDAIYRARTSKYKIILSNIQDLANDLEAVPQNGFAHKELIKIINDKMNNIDEDIIIIKENTNNINDNIDQIINNINELKELKKENKEMKKSIEKMGKDMRELIKEIKNNEIKKHENQKYYEIIIEIIFGFIIFIFVLSLYLIINKFLIK